VDGLIGWLFGGLIGGWVVLLEGWSLGSLVDCFIGGSVGWWVLWWFGSWVN
jgi:hypothetical protein